MDPLVRLQEWMDAHGVDAALVTNPVSIAYLSTFRAEPMERLMGLVLRGRDALLVVPGLEEESARATASVEVVAWRDGEDPWMLVRRLLGCPRRLGVEKADLTLAAWERLRDLAEEAEDVGPPIRQLRMRKERREVECLEEAARITDRVAERLVGEVRVGQTELEVAAAVDHLIALEGAMPSFPTMVQSGSNSAQPHHRPGPRRLAVGDLLLLDFGAAHRGYCADTTRVWVLGAATDRQLELHRVVLAAHDAAVAAVRPGVRVGEVDEAARAVIRAAGLGDHFIHRVGHGLGLEAHEAPSLDPGGETVLEEGMVVTIEPGVYLPGWGGVRIEDDVVVEQAGGRTLTAADRGLLRVG
jgi:Xaa-Pro dipeptidase